jgi:hypothetical protein
VRYFIYITNIVILQPQQIVWVANNRCNQENLLAQLHGGLAALKAPVNTLESNWACMVMTALAWNLKAWWALLLPVAPGRWQQRHREEQQWVLGLEFKGRHSCDCRVRRTGRKLVHRLLSWNPYKRIFWRLVSVLHCFLKSGSGCPDPPRPRVQSCRKSGETDKKYKRQQAPSTCEETEYGTPSQKRARKLTGRGSFAYF